jgi:hypothetical protein
MNNKSLIVLFILVTSFLAAFGQEEYPDCFSPKKISFPLGENISSSDEIYYQPEDKYTYWYKVKIADNCKLSYKLTTIGKDDDYELLMYRYSGNDFCNDKITKKLQPFSIINTGNLPVKKGELYYWSVVHLKGQGCGHVLELNDGNKKVSIKAIQNDCIEDAIVLDTVVEEMAMIDTVKPVVVTVPSDKNVFGYVVNSLTLEYLDANVSFQSINGVASKEMVNVNKTSGFDFSSFKGDTVVLSITKFGYETLLDTIFISSDTLKLMLNPIKIGEKLIMYHIYFHPNTYALKNESKNELKKLTQFMLENKRYIFEIQGHTNGNRAVKKSKHYQHLGEAWNFKGSSKKLSKFRAEKIKSYLIKNGVKENQLQTMGYGGDQMIVAKPKNMKQAMKNIRVEVIVVQ